MNVSTIAIAIATSVLSVSAAAQTTTAVGPGTAGSPHVKTVWTISGATIAITYGRPYLKGRAEAQMMPAGKPWRTGAARKPREGCQYLGRIGVTGDFNEGVCSALGTAELNARQTH